MKPMSPKNPQNPASDAFLKSSLPHLPISHTGQFFPVPKSTTPQDETTPYFQATRQPAASTSTSAETSAPKQRPKRTSEQKADKDRASKKPRNDAEKKLEPQDESFLKEICNEINEDVPSSFQINLNFFSKIVKCQYLTEEYKTKIQDDRFIKDLQTLLKMRIFTSEQISSILGDSGEHMDSVIGQLKEKHEILHSLVKDSKIYPSHISKILYGSGANIGSAIDQLEKKKEHLSAFIKSAKSEEEINQKIAITRAEIRACPQSV